MYEEVMDKEGIPLEFKYLSIVESALNPIAVSRVGATGLWQFMYNTGLIYNLKVNFFTDERKDPYKATQAACQYFKDMYNIYGDWLLVIASYNCGAGNVNRAIKRSGGKTNFWEIMPYLPKETRGYVPAFIAVTYVMNYSREHNLYPVTPAYSYFEVDTVKVSQPVNFQVLSRLIDLPLDVISYLNPVYKRNLIPDADQGYTLRLPTNKIALFMASEEAIYAQSTVIKPIFNEYASRSNDGDDNSGGNSKYETITKKVKKTHTVLRGETLASIADQYDCSSQDIKKLNHLRSTKLKKGQKIQVLAMVRTKVKIAVKEQQPSVAVVKRDSGTTGNQAVATKKDSGNTNTATTATGSGQQIKDSTNDQIASKEDSSQEDSGKALARNPKYIYHLVQPGDTLWNIAKRYEGVTVEMIKDINNLHDTNLKPGTRLKVIVNG
jgi:membrane-bound lytic murein transglycosylase D